MHDAPRVRAIEALLDTARHVLPVLHLNKAVRSMAMARFHVLHSSTAGQSTCKGWWRARRGGACAGSAGAGPAGAHHDPVRRYHDAVHLCPSPACQSPLSPIRATSPPHDTTLTVLRGLLAEVERRLSARGEACCAARAGGFFFLL